MIAQVNNDKKCATSKDCVKICESVPVTAWKINGGFAMSGSVDHDTKSSHSHKILAVKQRFGEIVYKMKPNTKHFGGHHHDDGHNH